jgi:hypothetical protein
LIGVVLVLLALRVIGGGGGPLAFGSARPAHQSCAARTKVRPPFYD